MAVSTAWWSESSHSENNNTHRSGENYSTVVPVSVTPLESKYASASADEPDNAQTNQVTVR